ncbi:MAG TPA: TonB-dependent receptor [Blastocatellia bacterium]|nr:TonB-dependent receptor [Blastocatellia bacterium]
MFGRSILRRLSVFATTVLLLSGIVVHGQDFTTLSGVITDPQAKVISGATVTITNSATGASRNTKSGDDGSYIFSQAPPGTYTIRVEAKGFKATVRESVQLLIRTPTTLDIQLEVGSVNETVQVTGGEAKINTQDATIGNAFTANQITNLPLEGRSVVSLLSLQPGVVYLGDSTDSRNGSVNGGKSDQANVTLDGVDVNDQQTGFAFNSVLRITTESVQEFRVTTTTPNADQGRSSGAQVSLATKGGTNSFHGSFFESHRNTITTANDFFNNAAGSFGPLDPLVLSGEKKVGDPKVPRAKLIRNVFGASFGGPILKDKLFFFLNYEGRRDASEVNVARTVPSALLRQGIIQYKNKTGQIVTLNQAGVANLDPAHIGPNPSVLEVFKQYPLPNDNTLGDGINFLGFRFTSPISVRFNTYFGRLDYNLSDKHNVFWRGNLQNDKSTDAQQFPGEPPTFTNLNNSKGFAIGDNYSLSPTLTNIFRYGYTRQGLEQAGASTLAAVSFRNLTDIHALTRSNGRITPVHNFVDDVAWVKGEHSLGFGTNIRFIRNNRFNFTNSFPSASTNASWLLGTGRNLRPADIDTTTGVAFSDAMMALLGIISQGNARYNFDRTGTALPVGAAVQRSFGADEYEWYGQDSWRLKSNLTLNFGLRYGLYSPPWETHGNQVAPNIRLGDWFNLRGENAANGIPSNQAPPIFYDLSGPENDGRGFYDWDKNNFAPRVSFAYSPGFTTGFWSKLTGGPGKTAIRGGAAMVYDRIGGGLAVTFDAAGSFGLSTALTNPSSSLSPLTAPRYTGVNNLPVALLPPPPAVGFPTKFPGAGQKGSFAITFGMDDNIKTPYSIGFNFSVQREFPKNFTLELAYVGREARNVLIQADLSMPVNLVDKGSNSSYFSAAQQLLKLAGTPIGSVPNIAYFENMFPATSVTATQLNNIYGDVFSLNPGLAGSTKLSATQVAYFLYNQEYAPDYTSALFDLDVGCTPACSKFGPFAFFNDQFSALAAWRSIQPMHYHSFQLLLRKRLSQGVQFDFNYTLSKSIDWGSGTERSGSFGGGFVENSWIPSQRQSTSDFDLRHQVNSNWIAELPFGRGKAFGGHVNKWIDGFIGGWQLSGIVRWTSGFAVSVGNGRFWPTNWNLTGRASRNGPTPETKTTKNAVPITGKRGPNLFPDPAQAIKGYKNTVVGDSGVRNDLRGDGYFSIDSGLGKSWRMPWENHKLTFRWETFNVTNTVRFDVNSLTLDLGNAGNFGKYSSSLTSPRVMQFILNYQF